MRATRVQTATGGGASERAGAGAPRVRRCPLRKILGDRGFTILELLVVIGIVGVLVSLLAPALGKARLLARQTREQSAARQISVALGLYANEAKGEVMPGYPPAAWVNGPMTVRDDTGNRVKNEEAQRYVWRLAPQLGYDLRGLYDNQKLLNDLRNNEASYAIGEHDFSYVASLLPSLGMNVQFVGGSDHGGDGSWNALTLRAFGRQYVKRLDEVNRPERLMSFVSARMQEMEFLPGFGRPEGYFRVSAPQGTTAQGRLWDSAYNAEAANIGKNSGFVSLRYAGRAVATMIDGHCEMLGWDQLGDMTRWANKATRSDWTIGK